MLHSGDHVFVAVSGGVDSVVLLDVLRRTASERGLTLTVAHLNHRWRRKASDADARFVESLAGHAGLPIVSETIADQDVSAHSGLGREGAAREVRRAFFLRVAARVGADRIATGHTATDRAESVLFNLVRGAGTDGLKGINAVDAPFIRPLIEVERDEILRYAQAQALRWREDASNADLSFARNRIRHRVLPELARINPRAVEAIDRAGDLVGETSQVGEFLVARLWPEIEEDEKEGEISIDRRSLAALPNAIRRLLLREGFRRVRGDLSGIERRHVDDAIALTASGSGHCSLDLPRLHMRVDGEIVVLAAGPPPTTTQWEFPVELGRTTFAEHGFALDLHLVEAGARRPGIDTEDRSVELADADGIAFPLSVRNRRDGDRFTPLGMDRPVKLKDFLISERVPFFERDQIPLVCDRKRIVWVAGVRLSDAVRVTGETQRILRLRLEAIQ